MTIHFINPGNLPFEAIALIGVSVKEGSGNIGRFGTGLKYAIAGTLRLGGWIEITTGEYTATFDTKPVIIRGKNFETIRASIQWKNKGKPEVLLLGFTTDYGKEWKPWMYVRELLSNCLDEGGTHGGDIVSLPSYINQTLVTVICPEFDEAYIDRKSWYLEAEPDITTPAGSLQKVQSNGIFYQGFLVGKPSSPPLFTYNLSGDIPLSEDRTMGEYLMMSRVARLLGYCSDREIFKKIFCCSEMEHFEGRVDLREITMTSTLAKDTLLGLWKNSPTKLNGPAGQLASSAFASEVAPPPYTPTAVERSMFEQGLTFLRDLGLDVTKVKWSFIDSEDAAFGYVIRDTKVIYLNRSLFSEGTSLVCRCMFEEYLHAEFKVEDFTREFQNKTISILARLYEEMKGKPL